jgi:hypothetical protein
MAPFECRRKLNFTGDGETLSLEVRQPGGPTRKVSATRVHSDMLIDGGEDGAAPR